MPMLKTSLFVAAVAASVLWLATIPAAFAHHHHDDGGGGPSGADPVHGAGSSHNPIIYHPVHGPGSSHNPIVVSKPGNGMAPGTVVRDHRNGKNCWYVVGAGGVISDSTCPHGGHR